MYKYGTVLDNWASGCHGVKVMVVHWMEPMFVGLVVDDGHDDGAWGWRGDRGGPGALPGFLGLLRVSGEHADWELAEEEV